MAGLIAELAINKATLVEIANIFDNGAKSGKIETDVCYHTIKQQIEDVARTLKLGDLNLSNKELLAGFRQATAY